MDKTSTKFVQLVADVQAAGVTDGVRRAFRQRVVDTVGCAIGALEAPPARVAQEVAYAVSGDRFATIWGTGVRTSVDAAAFANGVAARYLDFNDAFRGSVDVGHPADNIPALFALAEQVHASGEDLLEAVAIAYQAQVAMSNAIPLNDRGWDQPTAVVISSALGAGRLLNLSPEQLGHALAIAIVPNMAMHQTRCGELSWWKGCAAPMGARQGVYAAQLAALGMEGPDSPFDGINGFWAQFGSTHEIDLSLGSVWGLQMSNIKSWPVRDSCQIGIDAARELRDAGVDPSQIASIHVDTYKSSYRWAVQDRELWAPQTRETADHSLPFSIAATLLDGLVRPETFESDRFLDKDVLDMIGRMEIVVDDDFSSQTPGVKNCRVIATLHSGETKTAHVALTQDEIDAGKPDEFISEKFTALAARTMDDDKARSLLADLWTVDSYDDVAELAQAVIV